jgi:hypothetical protein
MGSGGAENGAGAVVLVHLGSLRDRSRQRLFREPPTLVEFTLEKTATGTLLRVVESGFDKIPPERRDEAFRMNDRGWGMQMQNIAKHVAA